MKKILKMLTEKPFLTAFLFFIIILVSNIKIFLVPASVTAYVLAKNIQFYYTFNEIPLLIVFTLILTETLNAPLSKKYKLIFTFSYGCLYLIGHLLLAIILPIIPLIPALIIPPVLNGLIEELSRKIPFYEEFLIFLLIKGFYVYLILWIINRLYLLFVRCSQEKIDLESNDTGSIVQ